MWWCLFMWQHDIFCITHCTILHCSKEICLLFTPFLSWYFTALPLNKFHRIKLTAFLSLKEVMKREIWLVDHWIPSSLFWRLTSKFTAHIIIKLGVVFFSLLHLLTHWDHPFISVPPPFLFTWVMTFLTSSIFLSFSPNLLSGIIISPWHFCISGMWKALWHFRRPGSWL